MCFFWLKNLEACRGMLPFAIQRSYAWTPSGWQALRIVSRTCIDRLRSLRLERPTYLFNGWKGRCLKHSRWEACAFGPQCQEAAIKIQKLFRGFCSRQRVRVSLMACENQLTFLTFQNGSPASFRMLNHPKSLSGALTVHCSGGFYLAFNFLFASFTWHQLSARFLFQSGSQVFTCCGSWQQESKLVNKLSGEKWRKLTETEKMPYKACLCVAERDCGFCMIVFVCFCYSYDFLCQTKFEEKREHFEARSLVQNCVRTSGRSFPCWGGYETSGQTQEAEICPTLRTQQQSSIQFLRLRIWLQVPARGKVEPIARCRSRICLLLFFFLKCFLVLVLRLPACAGQHESTVQGHQEKKGTGNNRLFPV